MSHNLIVLSKLPEISMGFGVLLTCVVAVETSFRPRRDSISACDGGGLLDNVGRVCESVDENKAEADVEEGKTGR